MGKIRENWRWRIAIITTGFLFTFGAVVISYIYKFDNVLAEENKKHLTEISSHIALHILTVAHDTEEALKTVSAAIAKMDTEEDRIEYLRKVAEQYSFVYVGYAGPDGNLRATVKSESVNIKDEDYFQTALKGEDTVTDLTRKIFYDHAVTGVLFAVPLGQEPQAGVLVAMLDINRIANESSLDNFGGNEYSYIIDKKGELILQNKSLDFNNLFKMWEWVEFKDGHTLESVLEDIRLQREGLVLYDNLGVEKYAYYRPLGINSWTIVNTISKQAVTEKTAGLTRELALIGIIMVLIFVALIFTALIFYGVSQSRRQAVEEKSAFLANTSHEIRTPMNAIVGISEILLREALTAKQRDLVLNIANSGRGLLTIINDILDISKIEAGKFHMSDEPYELESLLYDITAILAVRIEERPLEFLIDPAPDLPRVLIGDMSRVKQLLLNIAGNAVKFTRQGYVRMNLDYTEIDGGIILRVAVIDTGIGIKQEDIGRLFISFNQVDTHRNRNAEGTGLGLAISKNLCELMGGNISVQSEYGKGSVFTLTIRQGVRDRQPLVAPPPENARILICEPSESLRAYEEDCMKRLGLSYEFCSDRYIFAERLGAGGFTHALAGREILNGMEASKGSKVQILRLLSIWEHTFMEMGSDNIYRPLFTSQLSFALRGKKDNRTLKNVSVDMNIIERMPDVRILIVDDNEVNLQVASGLMQPYRMKIDCVLSGQEAVAAVQENSYDLVFMDHMMPGMDGIEAVRLIRSLPDERYKRLPIVVLTANATKDAQSLFEQAGFDGFLAKPIETVKLDFVLKKWLKEVHEQRRKRPVQSSAEAPPGGGEIPAWVLDYKDGEVDFYAGIEKIGSFSVYLEILRTYYRTTGAKLELMPKWLDLDRERFIVEIHGLKGASAAVVITGLADFAEDMENKMNNGKDEEVRTALPQFLELSKGVLAVIKNFLLQAEREFEKDCVRRKPPGLSHLTKEKLDELENAFLDFDTERLGSLLGEDFVGTEEERRIMERLRSCYQTYEFDMPVGIIRKYREQMEGKGSEL